MNSIILDSPDDGYPIDPKDDIIFSIHGSGDLRVRLPKADELPGRVLYFRLLNQADVPRFILIPEAGDQIENLGIGKDYIWGTNFTMITLVSVAGGDWFVISTNYRP